MHHFHFDCLGIIFLSNILNCLGEYIRQITYPIMPFTTHTDTYNLSLSFVITFIHDIFRCMKYHLIEYCRICNSLTDRK